MKYLMAIDAGTGSVRAVIFDENGNQKSFSSKEWTHKEESGILNSMNFDYQTNWKIVCSCIKKALKKANLNGNDIAGISASSMREGIILYDKNMNEIFGVANVDARADKEIKYINKNYPKLEEEYYFKSGQTFALGSLPRLMWVRDNKPEIYKKIFRISMISDWVLFKLSGILSSDPSNAGTSGIFSLESRQWLPDMAKKLDIKDNIFPKVKESGSVLGVVTLQASGITKLGVNTKVVIGGGDVQIGSIGLGIIKKNQVAILGGSFWQQIVNIDKNTKPPKDMSIRINPHNIKGLSQAESISFFSGLVLRWFRDVFAHKEMKKAKKKNKDVYEILEKKASKVPIGSYGIIPIFSDVMKYKKWYHASPSFLNLSLDKDKCNVASMFRSLEENAAIVAILNLEKVAKWTNIEIKEIVFAGGASKGKLFCQILADVSGCDIKVPKVIEATSLGCAISAGVGVGIYDSLEDGANKLVKWDKKYIPNKQNTQKYKEVKRKWIEAYKAQLELVDKDITTSMWKAPGI